MCFCRRISCLPPPASCWAAGSSRWKQHWTLWLINTVAGKGCFVAEPDLALFREQSLHLLEDHLAAAAELARTCGLSEPELAELLRRKWEESL